MPTSTNKSKKTRARAQSPVSSLTTHTPLDSTLSPVQQYTHKNHIDYVHEEALQLDPLSDPPLDKGGYTAAIQQHLADMEQHSLAHSTPISTLHSKKSKKKKKKSARALEQGQQQSGQSSNAKNTRGKDRIWNTTTNEERERIKEFWLNLGEEERKSLVKVEKEAVLKKMKEQQKHSCSCSVCGRKRTAIEEELEVLYDAYYEELEQYANQQQKFPPAAAAAATLGGYASVGPLSSTVSSATGNASGARIQELASLEEVEEFYEDESDEEELSEEDMSDEADLYSDEDYSERSPPEFFKFGNSLTVKGGILTVADDLLKNDGKKFIEMMEQLAERRMQREEEAAMEAREYDDEEDDDDYEDEEDLSEDYDDEDDEADALTEEQRMAEGRRMFQIFAARMFEQRVLTAYREKVAQERQAKLLEELEMEDAREKEREEKKLKEKEKKKDKKRQQQLKKEEERLKRETERLAEEAAQKAEEARKAEESKKKKDEQRLKREAEKKALEAERLRKEEERKKRLAEEKAREAKKREQQEKEERAKEEIAKREREAKTAAQAEVKAKREEARLAAQSQARAKEQELLALAAGVKAKQEVAQKAPSKTASPPLKPGQNQNSNNATLPKPLKSGRDIRGEPTLPLGNSPRTGPVQSLQHGSQQRPMSLNIIPQAQYMTPGSFPRPNLSHPSSLPIPLPPPGISPVHGLPLDPFGFNSPQSNASLNGSMGVNQNSMTSSYGPPGVVGNASAMGATSPNSRLTTPHQSRNLPHFYGGNTINTASEVRDDLFNEASLRKSSIIDDAIGAIGSRPSPARTTPRPAPIQRPSSVLPSRTDGSNQKDEVMGSRALLGEDDDDILIEPIRNRFKPNETLGASELGTNLRYGTWNALPAMSTWQKLNSTIPSPRHTDKEKKDRIRASCKAVCHKLQQTQPSIDGYFPVYKISECYKSMFPEQMIDEMEIITGCSMPANGENGGGTFQIRQSPTTYLIHYEDDPWPTSSSLSNLGSPRQGGSPFSTFGAPSNVSWTAPTPF